LYNAHEGTMHSVYMLNNDLFLKSSHHIVTILGYFKR